MSNNLTETEIIEGIVEAYRVGLKEMAEGLRQRLPELLDPRLVPVRFVDWLASVSGLSSDVPLSARLDATEFRRLIPRLVAIWALKFGQDSYLTVVRAVTGARSSFLDWPGIAPVLDDAAILPLFGVNGASYEQELTPLSANYVPAAGPWLGELFVEDLDGALDRDKVVDACRLVRPTEHGLHIAFPRFVENWQDETARWDLGTVGTAVIDEDTGLRVGPDAGDDSTASVDFDSAITDRWGSVVYMMLVTITAEVFRFVVRDDYEVVVTAPHANASTANVTLTKLSTAAVLGTATHFVDEDEVLLVRVTTWAADGGDLHIEVEIDGIRLIEYDDATPTVAGPCYFQAAAGTESFDVHWLIVLPVGGEVRVLPDGAPGAVTATSGEP